MDSDQTMEQSDLGPHCLLYRANQYTTADDQANDNLYVDGNLKVF